MPQTPFLGLCLLLFSVTHAKDYPVAASGNISAVLQQISPGDTVLLDSGVFSGSDNCGLIMSLDNTAIVGRGSDRTVVDCSGTSRRCVSVIGAKGVRLSGIWFKNGVAPEAATERSLRPDGSPVAADMVRGGFLDALY